MKFTILTRKRTPIQTSAASAHKEAFEETWTVDADAIVALVKEVKDKVEKLD